MENLLIFVIIGLFVGLVFLNIYFRVKVMKVYKRLVQNRVDFSARSVFNRQKIIDEVIPRYPEHEKDILAFIDHIRYSVRIATLLVLLITLLGAVLMYFR